MVDVAPVVNLVEQVQQNIGRVIVGKSAVIEKLLVAILSDGHVLLEDVPGTGKTKLARTLARSVAATFRRIQFTPDLLPTDVTGVNVFDPSSGEFSFQPGPIHCQILLADEINRAGPRTQSALLEAMEERQVTSDGETRSLPQPFLVLATQNPIELEGTFPLPEAQLDRFLMRLSLGFPEHEQEREILRRFRERDPLDDAEPVVQPEDVLSASKICRKVFVHPAVEDYIIGLVAATRSRDDLEMAASPRGTLALCRASQVLAAIRGRAFVLPDDAKELLGPILLHRVVPTTDAKLHGSSAAKIVEEIAETVSVPVEDDYATVAS